MNKLLLLFLFLMNYTLVNSQTYSGDTPRMIINIHIEGLNSELLHRFEKKYGVDGFSFFLNKGTELTNVSANYCQSNIASDVAAMHSGAYPNKNGIIAPYYFNPISHNWESCISMNKGMNTDNPAIKNYSPKRLNTTTLEDELSLFYPNESRIFSVASNPTEALLAAGHNAQGAFWLDDSNGKWTSSSIYGNEIPFWVKRLNDTEEISSNLKRDWYPLNDPSTYENKTSKDTWPIDIKYSSKDPFKYKQLKKTPFINELITSFVKQLIVSENFTQSSRPNVLNIFYDINDYFQLDNALVSSAREDQYLRMDKNLSELLSLIGKRQDLKKILFTLVGSGNIQPSVSWLGESNIPAKEVELDRIHALLNSYLMAVYGSGNWVENYSNNQLFLNRDLIEKEGLTLDSITNEVALLCGNFNAIEQAIPVRQLLKQGNPSLHDQLIKNSLYLDYSGDLFVILKPGRIPIPKSTRGSSMNNKIPMWLAGWRAKNKSIDCKISITQLAPTLSTILRIPRPNGSIESDVAELLQMYRSEL